MFISLLHSDDQIQDAFDEIHAVVKDEVRALCGAVDCDPEALSKPVSPSKQHDIPSCEVTHDSPEEMVVDDNEDSDDFPSQPAVSPGNSFKPTLIAVDPVVERETLRIGLRRTTSVNISAPERATALGFATAEPHTAPVAPALPSTQLSVPVATVEPPPEQAAVPPTPAPISLPQRLPRAMRVWQVGWQIPDCVWRLIFEHLLELGTSSWSGGGPIAALMLATHICKSWRTFILATRPLWSNLTQLAPCHLPRLSILLARGDVSPAYLTLDLRHTDPMLQLDSVGKVIAKHLSRLVSLVLVLGPRQSATWRDLSKTGMLRLNHAPLLRTLSITFPLGATAPSVPTLPADLFARKTAPYISRGVVAVHAHLLPDICPGLRNVSTFELLQTFDSGAEENVTVKTLSRIVSLFGALTQLALPAPLAQGETVHSPAALGKLPLLRTLQLRDADLHRGALTASHTLELFKFAEGMMWVRITHALRETYDFVRRKLAQRLASLAYVPSSTTTGALAIAPAGVTANSKTGWASFLNCTAASAVFRSTLTPHPTSPALGLVSLTISTSMTSSDWEALLGASFPALTTLFFVVRPSASTAWTTPAANLADLFSSVTLLGGARTKFKLDVPNLRTLSLRSHEPLLDVGCPSPFAVHAQEAITCARIEIPVDGVLDLLRGCGCPVLGPPPRVVVLEMDGVRFATIDGGVPKATAMLHDLGVRVAWKS